MESIADNSSPAGSMIAGNEDMLIQILKHLPARSLLRFKSVSKQWFQFIASPFFFSQYDPNPNPPFGLFLSSTRYNKIDFVPLNPEIGAKFPFRMLNSGVQILSSCGGLLCCCRYAESGTVLYVYNPTNKSCAVLPSPRFYGNELIRGVDLAFDPSISQIYKVIMTTVITSLPDDKILCNRTYSSETRNWELPKPAKVAFLETTRFNNGVYCNGAIHWYSAGSQTMYFDIDKGRLVPMWMPKMTYRSELQHRRYRYFGESSGHLHLIETYGKIAPDLPQFYVFEMEKDRSGWFVKYCVDLDPMVAIYSEMRYSCKPDGFFRNEYKILYVLETDNNGDPYMLLAIPGKIMRYNLRDGSFQVHMDFYPTRKDRYQVFPFFTCLIDV